jgi:FtsZ-binding cell division protein ZapB
MELFEVLKLVIGGGEVALLALVLYRFATNQTRESGNQGALIGIVADLSRNIQASTETLTGIKTCVDESQTLTAGMRREVQAAHTTQQEALASIRDALDALPDATAGAVKTTLTPDFDEIRAKLQNAVLSISSVCLKLDEMKAQPVSARPDSTEPKPDDSAPAAQEKKEEGIQ